MTSVLDDIPAIIGDALGDDVFLAATLTRLVPASGGDSFDPDAPAEQTYSCRGLHDGWSAYFIANGLVQGNERKVLILASTLSVEPRPGDKVTIRGETFAICPAGSSGQAPVTTDPAKAMWICRASA